MDIAILYPIESLEGWYEWDNPTRPTIGKDVPPGTDYNQIGDMLTGQIRKDFTFIHPEELLKDKYQIVDGEIRLTTPITHQEYKLLIIPSSYVLSVETLNKIKTFYDTGGKLLITHQFPQKSAEFGRDKELVELIKEIFGEKYSEPGLDEFVAVSNERGGKAAFLPSAEKRSTG